MPIAAGLDRAPMAICLQVHMLQAYGGFCCFPLQNREPKEDGVRNAKVKNPKKENQVVIRRVRGSCRLPRSMAAPRTVKSFVKNSSGYQHRFAGSSPGLKGVASGFL